MRAKIIFIASVFVLFFTNVLEAQIVIHANTDDVTITNTNTIWGWVGQITARLNESTDLCNVIPFQLPTIPIGESITDVSFSFNVISYSNQPTTTNIDLYGLDYRVGPSVDLINDYYAGASDVTATLIQDNILIGNVSEVGINTTSTAANINLVNFIETQYTNGAVAGNFIFLRFSPDAIGNTEAWNLDSENGSTPSLHPILTITTAATGPVAPVLAPIGDQTVEEEANLIVPISATDANGDILTITATGLPSFAILTDNGDGTATISLNPSVGDEGVYPNIVITVTDSGGLTDSETISITVTKKLTLIEIIATGATGFVSDSILVPDGDIWVPTSTTIRNPEILDEIKVGLSDVVGEPNLTSGILPFQLPARPSGKTVQDVVLSVFVSFGRTYTTSAVDLYGLPYDTTSSEIFSKDHYSGAFGNNQNGRGAIGLQENILVKTNPLSLLDTQRWVSTANNSALATFINDQYDNGAVAGDWVFFRFSVNNPLSQEYHYFGIDGGNGRGLNVDGSYNSNPKPAVLKIDFYNPIDKTTTWDGISWSNGSPDNIKIATITGDLTIVGAESVHAKELIVQNNATITINQGGNLVIHNSLTVDAGSKIFVESGGSFITADDAATITINGDFWVERTSRATLSNYTYWSSPVNTTVQAALINSGSPIVYRFDTPTHNDANNDGQDDGFAAWIPVTGTMNPGQGYAAYGSDDGVTASVHNVTFKAGEGTGVKEVNNGVVTINTDLSLHTADPNVDDWNLLGNPYSTAILGRPFMVQNPTIGTLYFWTHTYPISGNYYSVDDYASFNLSGGTLAVGSGVVPDGKIASGQGFFTDVTVAGSVTFNASMQIDNVYDDYNNNFYKGINAKKSLSESVTNPFILDRFWVNVYNDNSFNQILIAFAEDATNGFDHQYDGEKLELGNELMFYSIENDRKLVIQGKPLFVGDEVIPLGYKSNLSSPTTFKIELPFFEGRFKEDSSPIYLVDKYLNITHNLKQGFYEFEISGTEIVEDRFEITFVNKTLGIDDSILENQVRIFPNPVASSFTIHTNNLQIETVKLFDIQGKLLQVFKESENYSIQNIQTGVYILNINTQDGRSMNKKIIKL